ncbi:o-succinylbenzoate synthase [Peribacillus asahii]|uniref:o-succinylbenzoate synthase n=1 Tax=Peribacillus asahii TaxID=228899 RepID=A0A398B9R9_9BACI|nr:o-succinylbenzoate synthase [Peribacillus asahii]RID86567.1 o-succinylbenzoate synthase [Peribacillus asahii]
MKKPVSITLRIIEAPLKSPFQTHLETVTKREVIVVEARNADGLVGYGEAVPFSSPWYTEETLQTVFHLLEDFLIPLTFQQEWKHPSELPYVWSGIRRNRMAKSALEQAIWDLYAKQQDVYIGKLFGGERTEVAAGVVIATSSVDEALRQIEEFEQDGYQRYKVKISPRNDITLLSTIRAAYPTLPLMADANSAYSLNDIKHLQKLDQFMLQMIEQPLGHDDIVEHSFLQKQLKTPICLDESICSFHDAKSALLLGSGKILNIKMARVGGWTEAVNIHHLCVEASIPVWCGGMIEFGISRAHNIALASLSGFTIPGDLSSSSKYWEQDIIEPELQVVNGKITVPKSAGIGFTVRQAYVESITTYKQLYVNKV